MLKHLKEECVTARKCSSGSDCKQFATLRQDYWLKITTPSLLFFAMNALPPGHIEEYDRLLEKRVSVVRSLFIIENDLRLKREKETTVCYEWRP